MKFVGIVDGTAIGIVVARSAAGGACGYQASESMSGRATATTGIGIAGIDGLML